MHTEGATLIGQELVPTHENTDKVSRWISLLRARSNSTRLTKWLPDHCVTEIRVQPCTLVWQEAGKYIGWWCSAEISGKSPVWDFIHCIFGCQGSNQAPDLVPASQVHLEPLVRAWWPLRSCNMFPNRLTTHWWAGRRTLHKHVTQNWAEREKSDNLEQLLCYWGLDYSACWEQGGTAESFWKQIYLITARAGWLTVLWKVSWQQSGIWKD